MINDINKGTSSSYACIISEIKQRAGNVNCKFSFEGRAANKDADSLANFLNSLDEGRHVWFHPHDPLCIPLNVVFDQ